MWEYDNISYDNVLYDAEIISQILHNQIFYNSENIKSNIEYKELDIKNAYDNFKLLPTDLLIKIEFHGSFLRVCGSFKNTSALQNIENFQLKYSDISMLQAQCK